MSAVFQYRNTNFSFFRKTPLSMASIPLIGHRHFDKPLMRIRWCSLRRGACERDCRSDPVREGCFLVMRDPDFPLLQSAGTRETRVALPHGSGAPLGHRDSERHPLACRTNDWPGDDDLPTVLGLVGDRVNRI